MTDAQFLVMGLISAIGGGIILGMACFLWVIWPVVWPRKDQDV